MSKETVTLDNFADWHGEVHGVEIKSALPLESYVPSGDINIHLGRIARAARFGHLGSVTFTGYSERSFTAPGVSTLNEDGSATAAFSAVAIRAPRGRSDVNTVAPFMFNRGTANVKINFDQEGIAGNFRDPNLWAGILDLSIKEELRASSQKKLLNPKGARLAGGMLSIALPVTIATLAGTGLVEFAKAYGEELVVVNGFMQAAAHFMPEEAEANHPEITFLPFLPLDRLGLVQAYTRTRKFTKAK